MYLIDKYIMILMSSCGPNDAGRMIIRCTKFERHQSWRVPVTRSPEADTTMTMTYIGPI